MNLRAARLATALAVVPLAAACGSSHHLPDDEVGTYEPEGGSFTGADGGGAGILQAHVEENHMVVTIVTRSCAGACPTVEAVASGGAPPYAFAWSDGSTAAERTVCPTADTKYVVSVTDTGQTGEITRAPMTATAAVTADVIECPDGGAFDGGACADNGSFEGTPMPEPTTTDIGAPPWRACRTDAGLTAASIIASNYTATAAFCPFPAARDGASYLRLSVTSTNTMSIDALNGVTYVNGEAWEPLCAPLRAGVTYHFQVDLASNVNACGTSPVSLAILGGTSACDGGRVLWSSPTTTPSWKTYCATFTPAADTTYLGLAGVVPTDAGFMDGTLVVDRLVPVDSCP